MKSLSQSTKSLSILVTLFKVRANINILKLFYTGLHLFINNWGVFVVFACVGVIEFQPFQTKNCVIEINQDIFRSERPWWVLRKLLIAKYFVDKSFMIHSICIKFCPLTVRENPKIIWILYSDMSWPNVRKKRSFFNPN